MSARSPNVLNHIATEGHSAAAEAPAVGRESVPPAQSPRARPRRHLLIVLTAIVVLSAVVYFAHRLRNRIAAPGSATFRLATVERRDFVRTLRLFGTTEAIESYKVNAPRLTGSTGGGGQMIITKLTPAGTKVKRGDVLVEFDRQSQQKTFLDKQAEYRDLVDQIEKKQADQAAARAQDDTDLKQAEVDFETAKLELQKNEILPHIEAEKNQQNLLQAEATLKQLRDTYNLKRQAAKADLQILEIQRDRARDAMLHAQADAEKMSIKSPLDGMVVLNTIWKGGSFGEVQEGEEVRPGLPFLQVVNPQAMQVRARVNQADIDEVHVGQAVQVRLDAYPDLVLPGKVESISAVATSGMSNWVRAFGVVFSIQGSDPRLMPDLSAAVDLLLDRVPKVLVAPRDAVAEENGRAYVYAKNGSSFEKRPVKTGAQDAVNVVIESGVEAGAVLLRHPQIAKAGFPG